MSSSSQQFISIYCNQLITFYKDSSSVMEPSGSTWLSNPFAATSVFLT